jgi:hypothetical protein
VTPVTPREVTGAAIDPHSGEGASGGVGGSRLGPALSYYRAQVKSFYRNHHLTMTTNRRRDGAGGWMDLGGMWGGFGW